MLYLKLDGREVVIEVPGRAWFKKEPFITTDTRFKAHEQVSIEVANWSAAVQLGEVIKRDLRPAEGTVLVMGNSGTRSGHGGAVHYTPADAGIIRFTAF